MDLMTTNESSTRWKWTGAAGKGSCFLSWIFLASTEPRNTVLPSIKCAKMTKQI